MRVPLGGGSATTIAAGDAYNIIVSATSLYWLSGGDIVTEPVGGGSPTTLVTSTTQGSAVLDPGLFAVDSTNIYWSESWEGTGPPYGWGIVKQPLGGGSATTLASGAQGGTYARAIAVEGGSIYWLLTSGGTGGSVLMVPVGGGTTTTLASDSVGTPQAMAVDATSVYWSDNATIFKMALTGGVPTTLASQQNYPSSIAVDATSIYWTNGSSIGGTTMKAPLTGGSPTTLASSQTQPGGIAVDATSVYWANDNDPGQVMRAPKQ
jgi:hypothetical protein